MAELHALAGYASIALLALLTVVLVASRVMGAATWLGLVWLAAIAIVMVESLIGLGLLVFGARPRDLTHVLYAIVVTSLVAGAPVLTTTLQDRTRLKVLAGSAAVATAVAVRLLQTG